MPITEDGTLEPPYRPAPPAAAPIPPKQPNPNSATQFLTAAGATISQRGVDYDAPDEGERSMGKTVAAFNTITGQNLTESEGWLLMEILKNVRQWQKPEYHEDSALDAVSYSALKAEALAAGR